MYETSIATTMQNGNLQTDNIFKQDEIPLYGSSRVGLQRFSDRILSHTFTISGDNSTYVVDYPGFGQEGIRVSKYFEINNDLGNALVVISDQKVGIGNVNGLLTRY